MAVLAVFCAPASATVHITSLKPSLASPQPIGTMLGWTATATDTSSGPLTFQFSVAPPNGTLAMAWDFNVGTLNGSTWKGPEFPWALTGTDGTYQVQVVAEDFTSGETDSQTVSFTVTSPITGADPVIVATQNPLVALFIAPPCATGSFMRVSFQPSGAAPSTTATTTNWADCQPVAAMTFEIAGMYPSTAYNMYAQVATGGKVVNGATASFTTGVLPSGVTWPSFTVVTPDSPSDPNRVILHSLFDVRQRLNYPDVATDLSGNIIWYNYPNDLNHVTLITRPFPNGYLAIQNGPAWIPGVQSYQALRQFDWAGNIVRQTNTGIIGQQLLTLGDPDAKPCSSIAKPPPVGSACLGIFHHDAIQTLPNGYMAALLDVEKIFPAGTQGDTSGLPVDIVGDILVVLDQNWNVVWYWDSFDPAGGGNGYPLLPITRTAVLDEGCKPGESLCLTLFLVGPGVAPNAHDWLHCNSLYYWPHDGAPAPSTAPGDIIVSSRHQDWVMKIDYQDGAGTQGVKWRMGPGSPDFTFENIYSDPWPWFSHQHEVGIENSGTGVMTVLDNGNTRLSPPTGPHSSTGGVPGLGKAKCGPNDCNTRGMALTIDESAMTVAPVISDNLGVFSDAMGSAQLLADGNYFFLAAIVVTSKGDFSHDIQMQPVAGTDSGPQVMNISGPAAYRSWQMPNLYSPPIT